MKIPKNQKDYVLKLKTTIGIFIKKRSYIIYIFICC